MLVSTRIVLLFIIKLIDFYFSIAIATNTFCLVSVSNRGSFDNNTTVK